MKTFVVLFMIAVSLPSEAQRVKENVRQRVEIVDHSQVAEVPEVVAEDKGAGNSKKRGKLEESNDASRKK